MNGNICDEILISFTIMILTLLFYDPAKKVIDNFFAIIKNKKKNKQLYLTIKDRMPKLILEFQKDMEDYPLNREFVLMKKGWVYNGDGKNSIIVYYYEDHPDLVSQLSILENLGLIKNITYNNVERYRMTEELVDLLSKKI